MLTEVADIDPCAYFADPGGRNEFLPDDIDESRFAEAVSSDESDPFSSADYPFVV